MLMSLSMDRRLQEYGPFTSLSPFQRNGLLQSPAVRLVDDTSNEVLVSVPWRLLVVMSAVARRHNYRAPFATNPEMRVSNITRSALQDIARWMSHMCTDQGIPLITFRTKPTDTYSALRKLHVSIADDNLPPHERICLFPPGNVRMTCGRRRFATISPPSAGPYA